MTSALKTQISFRFDNLAKSFLKRTSYKYRENEIRWKINPALILQVLMWVS